MEPYSVKADSARRLATLFEGALDAVHPGFAIAHGLGAFGAKRESETPIGARIGVTHPDCPFVAFNG